MLELLTISFMLIEAVLNINYETVCLTKKTSGDTDVLIIPQKY